MEKFYWLNFVKVLKFNGMTVSEFLEQSGLPRKEFMILLRADKNPPKEWVFDIVRITQFPKENFYSEDVYDRHLKDLEDDYVGRIWTSLPPCFTCGRR